MRGRGAMRCLAGLALIAALTGCGAEDAPLEPRLSTSVSVGTGGVSTATGVSLSKGPLGVWWRL